MIDLFLNNKKIEIASNENIKLTRENPYITSSGDYTLEVSAPLAIIENRKFFGAWQRIEKRKFSATYDARLYVNNICVLNGSAKITSSDHVSVKMQLFGDRSEFNAVFGEVYIDELTLPYFKGVTGWGSFGGSSSGQFGSYSNGSFGSTRTASGSSAEIPTAEGLEASIEAFSTFVFVPIHLESNNTIVNNHTSIRRISGAEQAGIIKNTPQWNLLFVIKRVFSAIGYSVDFSEFDKVPYNHIMVVNTAGVKMRNCLPHWTLKDFIEQVQNFFGCIFIFSSSSLHVTMSSFTNVTAAKTIKVDAEEDFNVDVSEDNKVESIGVSNLHYDLGDSEYHNNDFIAIDKIDTLPVKEYETFDALLNAYEGMSSYDKSAYMLHCPAGYYCQWIYQGVKDLTTKIQGLIHVNQFGDLIRVKDDDKDDSDNTIDIKIVPVAIAEDISVGLLVEIKNATSSRGNIYGIDTDHPIMQSSNEDDVCYQIMPSVNDGEKTSASGTFGGKASGVGDETDVSTTYIQDLIEGDSDNNTIEKPDRIEVFFYDGAVQRPTRYEFSGQIIPVDVPAVFTAYDSKNLKGITHEKWSMTLNKDVSGVKTMGLSHKSFSIDQTKKYTIRFLSDRIPSATDIFIIKNRRFYCQKIEISLKNGKMNKLMTGYFFEID